MPRPLPPGPAARAGRARPDAARHDRRPALRVATSFLRGSALLYTERHGPASSDRRHRKPEVAVRYRVIGYCSFMSPESLRLSKSRYLSGLQCHKQLWWRVHEPEAPELTPTPGQENPFSQRGDVGERAPGLRPRGALRDVAL